MDFDRPYFLLLLLPAVAGVVWSWKHSLTRWTAGQAGVCLAVRLVLLLLVALALAGPRWVTETREVAVVFLRDDSASMGGVREGGEWVAEWSREADSAEVVFAAMPEMVRPFGESGRTEPSAGATWREATDLAAALDYAAAVLPADRPGRVVVLSDGVATAGRDPTEAAAALAERGIEIDTRLVVPPERPEVAVVALHTPATVREGEVFDLKAEIHSTTGAAATLRLYQDNLLVAEQAATLTPGLTTKVFPNIRAADRTGLYEVEVVAAEDTRAENNRRKVMMMHGGRARVLIVDRDPAQSQPLAEGLRVAEFVVEVRPPAGFPREIEGLEAFDLVVFADAPAADFTDGQMSLLDTWVRTFGGGFLMVGGEESFGAGGYSGTPLAGLLPVRLERQEREETPVVAVLVILDRSGSMSAPVGGQTKMSLANEGAALALEVLQQKDLFGVFAVDTRVQDVVPLGKIGDKAAASRRIAGITAGGGGIYVYTALAEAFPRLRDARARIKHIILFSDAADAEEKTPGVLGGGPRSGGTSALDLAAAMLASRITLSVVALGSEQDRDVTFLRQLAAQGGGRFYLTPDATALPRLFTLETLRAAESSLREEAFFVRPTGTHPMLDGIDWSGAPLLLGMNIAQIKPGAELLLRSESGDPALAVWRYGLGQAAAFTSDAKARWASEWLGWPGFGKFWGQVARALARGDERRDLVLTVREQSGELVVEAEAVTAEGTFRNGLDVTVSLAPRGAAARTLPAPQVAPGLYRAVIPTPSAESILIAVHETGRRPVSTAWTREYPEEYRPASDGAPMMQSLSALTRGWHQPEGDAIFRPSRTPARTRRDLAPFLLALAVMLWPVDVWLRRRDWGNSRGMSLPPFSRPR